MSLLCIHTYLLASTARSPLGLMLCLDIETMEGSEKDRFLGLFYDHYIIWCVPPKSVCVVSYSWLCMRADT